MVTMRLTREVHCRLSEALRSMHMFALLYGESRFAALGRPGVDFICEPLSDEAAGDTMLCREAFFAQWKCSPPFQLPVLCGIVWAASNGLTTTMTFEAVYEPDAGIVGAIFDRCVGRRLAKGAATAFFQRLSRFVEQDAGLDSLLNRLLAGGRSTGRT